MPSRSTLFIVASIASFVASTFTFVGGNSGLGAVFAANGAVFIALAASARATEKKA
jgi:hypothetical protein